MSGFEPVSSETIWKGTIITAGVQRFRHADGEVVSREKVWHPGAVGILALDDHGFLLTGRDIQDEQLESWNGERPLFLESSRRGIFAVGDVRSGSVKRVASAVGEGSMAVTRATAGG